MNHRIRTALSTLVAAIALSLVSASAFAADADPAVARIDSFYGTLLDTMKEAKRLSVKARYDKLEPAVRSTFDLAAMTRIAVGPQWTTLAPDDQKALVEQFGRFTVATYANRFDGWSGERFEVQPTPEARGENRIVHSALVRPNGDPVVLNYLVHSTGAGWQAIDVYLSGTISELSTRRSEFGALLKNGGAAALIDSLRQRADKLLQPA